MGKIAFVFPGQGAQYKGMCQDIYNKYKSARDVFEIASNALGFNVADMIFDGSDEELKLTKNTQPIVLTASIACMKALLEYNIKPDVMAGLSLGEYTALVAAGSIDFGDAVKIVRKRGTYMQEAVPAGKGSMAAIIGLENNIVEDICLSVSKDENVFCANYNCPGQIVISGIKEAVEKASKIANEKGAKRVIILNVSAPFHSKFMKPAADKLKPELESIKIKNTKIPVVSNVDAKIYKNENEIIEKLLLQIYNSVRWEQSIKTMIDFGVDTFIEIGPGKTLTSFLRKISRDVKAVNIDNVDSLDKAVAKCLE